MPIRAEIISIGDELTSGQRLDTNSQWLSVRLAELGVSPAFHTTVGDTLEDNIQVFRIAARRADLVISTGGLGPTADDLTREAMAAAFDRPLEFRSEAMAHIESLFAKRRRPMPERNRVQALFPATSKLIPNPHGTAPGIDLFLEAELGSENALLSEAELRKQPGERSTPAPPGRLRVATSSLEETPRSEPAPTSEAILSTSTRLFALPGVPAEMIQMWNETVVPRLIEMGIGKQRWFYRVLKVFGIGESDVEAKLPDLIERDRIPRVGITVSKATISLRIACLAENEQAAMDMSRSTEAEIHAALGELVFGQGDDELDDVVHRRLRDRNESLSVIEIGGESIIAPWLSRHRNQQDIELGRGLVAAQWLPSLSPHEQIDQMKELVERQRRESDTDWCLAIGPYPIREAVESQAGMPTCQFVIALAGRDYSTRSERFEMGGHPELIFQRIAKAGLDYFRRHAR